MVRYDFRTPRLFIDQPLYAGGLVMLTAPQANYVRNVLRLQAGDELLTFNGQDGEWRAALTLAARREVTLKILEQTRPQPPRAELQLLFAPLKHARLDYMVQKAVEMGATRLWPVITEHTQPQRVNLKRMRANVIEAAEQCGILNVPEVAEPRPLGPLIAGWTEGRLLIFCDETAEGDPLGALGHARAVAAGGQLGLAVLIGPEGGFDGAERQALGKLAHVVRLSLGPRILRADTAAVAALALVQAVLGDWAEPAVATTLRRPNGMGTTPGSVDL